MRKHIYIAYTGGTIGMKSSAKGYVPESGYLTEILRRTTEFNRPELPLFTIREYPSLMDSADMTPDDWQIIAQDIADHYQEFDGFIILHGTDTMSYTASALSFMLQDLTKPVIVTGSQIPLAEIRSDGQANLLNALYLAAHYPINEVCLYFNNYLYRGNRTTKAYADGFEAFSSPNYPPLVEVGIGITLNGQPTVTDNHQPLTIKPIAAQPVGVVSLYPGISDEVISNTLLQPVKALIIQTYGVGNAPQRPSLLSLLAQADERGVIVVNITQCLRGRVNMEGYAGGNALSECGVLDGSDMTLEAALTKLHYLLSQPLNQAQIKALFCSSLAGERS